MTTTTISPALRQWVLDNDQADLRHLLLIVPDRGPVVTLKHPDHSGRRHIATVDGPSDSETADAVFDVASAQTLLERIGITNPTYLSSANMFAVTASPEQARHILDSGLFAELRESGRVFPSHRRDTGATLG